MSGAAGGAQKGWPRLKASNQAEAPQLASPAAGPHPPILASRAMSGGQRILRGLLGWVSGWTWAWRTGFAVRGCGLHVLCPGDPPLPPEVSGANGGEGVADEGVRLQKGRGGRLGDGKWLRLWGLQNKRWLWGERVQGVLYTLPTPQVWGPSQGGRRQHGGLSS